MFRKDIFKSKRVRKVNINIIIVLIVSILLLNNKYIVNILSNSFLYYIKKESSLIKLIKNHISNPSEIVYYTLNKAIDKKSLDSFLVYEEDNSYDDNKSDFTIINNDKSDDPLVYIYNTHQLEEYDKSSFEYSIKPNVMIASYLLRDHLKDRGIPSIVETNSIREYLNKNDMDYDDSYHASEYYARSRLNENKSIKYLLDIHRDSAGKNVTSITINNKAYTRVMFLVGFEHTKEGLSDGFAEELERILERDYPGISRGIIYRKHPSYIVYNNNLDGISTLIEVGGVDSSLEEVNNTMEALSYALKEYIGENNE